MHTLDVPGSGPSQHLGLEMGPALGEAGTGSPSPMVGMAGTAPVGQHTQEADSRRADGVAAWDRLLVTGG